MQSTILDIWGLSVAGLKPCPLLFTFQNRQTDDSDKPWMKKENWGRWRRFGALDSADKIFEKWHVSRILKGSKYFE